MAIEERQQGHEERRAPREEGQEDSSAQGESEAFLMVPTENLPSGGHAQ
jgi:hypothetical protein